MLWNGATWFLMLLNVAPTYQVVFTSSLLLCLRLLSMRAALDQLRPEFALTVPPVSGRLLLATTSRLLLRAPHMVTAAAQPMLVASHLQLDCDSVGDMWGGECFLTRRSPPALQAWVNRNW